MVISLRLPYMLGEECARRFAVMLQSTLATRKSRSVRSISKLLSTAALQGDHLERRAPQMNRGYNESDAQQEDVRAMLLKLCRKVVSPRVRRLLWLSLQHLSSEDPSVLEL